jgi:hypothetical protein
VLKIKYFLWVGLFVFFLFLGNFFLSGYFQEVFEIGHKTNSLLLKKPIWSREVKGNYQDFEVTFIIEFDEELCQNRDWCGFVEHNGKFEDVANAVAYAVSLLNGQVKVNMLFNENDSYDSVEYAQMENTGFDVSVPIRFIFYDGDRNVFPLKSTDFSAGWGVDPKTLGLVVFFGSSTLGNPDYAYVGILEVFMDIAKIQRGSLTYKTEERQKMFDLWTDGDMTKFDGPIEEKAILKLLSKNE